MAKASRDSTSITWIWIWDIYPGILKICGSPQLCGPWLIAQIAAGRVQWRANTPLTDEQRKSFWQNSSPSINFMENSATKLEVAPPGTVTGLYHNTLLGLEVAREDIKALGVVLTPTATREQREGTKGHRISELARLRWRQTNGVPPKSLDNDQVWRLIAADYEAQYGVPVPDRTTILRNPTIGRLPRR
jgi:hypothetical protein